MPTEPRSGPSIGASDARSWRRADYEISTDRRRIQLDVVHGYLARSYWAPGIPRERVERSLAESLCFGVYELAGGHQVGFARAVTDYTTFAWIGDVFILEAARGNGLAIWLMEVVAGHPELRGLRRWLLATRDAHGLYRKIGFTALTSPADFMERRTAPSTPP